MSPIKFEARVYKSKKWAEKRFKWLKNFDKIAHSDFKQYPKLKYLPKFKRYIVSWSHIDYPRRRKRRKRKKC